MLQIHPGFSALFDAQNNHNYSLTAQSFPKRRSHSSSRNEDAIYPISNAPHYPNAQQVRNALRQARLTETELSVEHVEMLLNVLVLDGEVEKVMSRLVGPG